MGTRLGAIALALLVLGVAARPVLAQETHPETAEGDLLWTFAAERPFFDQRVRLAFVLIMDTQPLLEGVGLWPELQLGPASAAGAEMVAAGTDKGHGWREVLVRDPDGYEWAVGVLIPPATGPLGPQPAPGAS